VPRRAKIQATLESTFTRAQASREAALAHVTLAKIPEQLRPDCPGNPKS
jgi:hypothetical protein